MNTLQCKIFPVILLYTMLSSSGFCQSGDDCSPKVESHEMTLSLNLAFEPVSEDEEVAFVRDVCATTSGKYEVVIRDSEGNVRCKGFSEDEKGAQKHGEYTFYYPDGTLESRGRFIENVKVGKWQRWNKNNEEKAPKYYPPNRKNKLESLIEN